MEITNEKKEKKKVLICVIILVIIISTTIIILMYQKYSKNNLNNTEIMSLENQILEYEGDEIVGEDVKLLLAKIMSDNLQNSDSRLSKIEYNIKTENEENSNGNIKINLENKSKNMQEIVNLRNSIINDKIYEIKYAKEKGIVISISINSK